MDISVYTEYVDNNIDEIVRYVDEQFHKAKDFLKVKLVRELRNYLTPVPVHYVFKESQCSYDCSGELVKDGIVSLNQTVNDFLENEYSGTKVATYISGMGWSYQKYEDELHYYTIELAADIMFPAIRNCIEQHFNKKMSDEQFKAIKEECGGFDDIYDNCIASGFFFCYPAIEFTGIGKIKLTDIVEKG